LPSVSRDQERKARKWVRDWMVAGREKTMLRRRAGLRGWDCEEVAEVVVCCEEGCEEKGVRVACAQVSAVRLRMPEQGMP
jgi:hypothetical protein